MNYRMQALPSPYAQSNQAGQTSDPVSQIIKLIAPIVKHITKDGPNMGTPMGAAMGGGQAYTQGAQQNPMFQDVVQSNQALGPAQAKYNQAQSASDTGLQDYLTSLQDPRAAMPQQKPAMGGKESLGAGIVAALAAAAGVRPQFLQQGIQGYTGAREQNAQMNYSNETNAYNLANDQRDRELQAKQIGVNDLSRKEQLAFQLLQQAGGDVEKAKDLYRQYNDQARQRKWQVEDQTKKDETAKQTSFISRRLYKGAKSIPDAELLIQEAAKVGYQLTPDDIESIKAQGRQAALSDVYKKPPVSVAEAQSRAKGAGFKPGDPEYSAIIETGKALADLKKNATDAEYRQQLQYLQEGRISLQDIRDAASMARTQVMQGGQDRRNQNTIQGANYRAGLSQDGQDRRQGITQANVNARTQYVRESIAAIAAGKSQPSLQKLGPLSPQELQSIQKEIDAFFGDPGNVPMTVQPGQITPNGTAPIRRDNKGLPIQKPKQAATAPKTTPKPQSGPVVTKRKDSKGKEVIRYDFTKKK